MSPDEQVVHDALRGAVRRARIVAAAEALAAGFAVSAFSPIAAVVVAAGVLAWRLRASTRPVLLRSIERTHRDARNLFVTADELSRGVLAAKPVVRQRVFERAAIESKRLNLRALVPVKALTRAWICLLYTSPSPRDS